MATKFFTRRDHDVEVSVRDGGVYVTFRLGDGEQIKHHIETVADYAGIRHRIPECDWWEYSYKDHAQYIPQPIGSTETPPLLRGTYPTSN